MTYNAVTEGIRYLHDRLREAGWTSGVDGEWSDGKTRCGAVYTMGQARIFVSPETDRSRRFIRDLDQTVMNQTAVDEIVDQLLAGQFPPDLFVPSIRRPKS